MCDEKYEGKPFELFICTDFNEKDAGKLEIHNGDFRELIKELAELAGDTDNACICANSFKEILDFLKNTTIHYQTDEAWDLHANVLYIHDIQKMREVFSQNGSALWEVWLGFFREVCEDIDTFEDRYGRKYEGEFLRSLMVHLLQFELREGGQK